jgi:integrase
MAKGEQRKRRGHGEGGIYKRESDKMWVGSIDLGYEGGKRQRKIVYGKTRAQVVGKLDTEKERSKQGIQATDERLTVGRFLGAWLEGIKANVRPSTFESYSERLNVHIIPKIGSIKLAKLSPQIVERYVASELKTELSPKTVAYHLSILRMALNKAMRWGLVVRNVAKLVDAPRVPKFEVAPITPEQARKFLEALKGHPYAVGDVVKFNRRVFECILTHKAREDCEPDVSPALWKPTKLQGKDCARQWAGGSTLECLFTTMLTMGLRRGEALGLRWADVDFVGRTLTVNQQITRVGGKLVTSDPKTAGSKRVLELPDSLLSRIKQHRSQQLEDRMRAGNIWNETGLVFTTKVGTPHDPRRLKRVLDRVLKQAGLAHYRVHDLRHMCATLLLAQGVELKVVSEILGHSNIQTTANIYAAVLPNLKRQAADLLGGILNPVGVMER